MKRYLVFDAHCSACNQVTETIKETAGDKLETISIHDPKARTLLDQVYPEGWEYAPYLVIVDHGRTQAWMGWAMAWRLAWLFGPSKTWRVWTLARQYGILLPLDVNVVRAPNASRRQFLKKGLLVGLAALVSNLLSLSFFDQEAHAGSCGCIPSYCGCIQWGDTTGCTCYTGCHPCSNPPCNTDYYVETTCYCALECGGLRYCMTIYCLQCGSCA
jgi:predicted DCC family thiol-disulfide oxidoreductase YuxK